MSLKLKVRKGDLVQMLTGKDRGKQGRVLDVRKGTGRVIVENLNMVKRHQRPKPMKDPSRMGAPQVIPGGIIEKASAVCRLERDGRLPGLQPADPRRDDREGSEGRHRPRARLQARRLRPGDRSLMATREAPDARHEPQTRATTSRA